MTEHRHRAREIVQQILYVTVATVSPDGDIRVELPLDTLHDLVNW